MQWWTEEEIDTVLTESMDLYIYYILEHSLDNMQYQICYIMKIIYTIYEYKDRFYEYEYDTNVIWFSLASHYKWFHINLQICLTARYEFQESYFIYMDLWV